MQRAASTGTPLAGAIVSFGTVGIVAYVVMLLFLMEVGTYDLWGGFVVAPVLIGVSLPILSRYAAREGDRTLFWLLFAALLFKLFGAVARYKFAFDVYGGMTDAQDYHAWGVDISHDFWNGDFSTALPSVSGSDFIRLLTGISYTIIGPTRAGGYLFYSWLGFWGLFLFYRAYTIAVPEGRKRLYAWLVFFLPSMVYWPSSIGKEAWMMFTLGIAAYGAARVYTGETFKGIGITGVGMWLGGMPRAHVAGIFAVGFAGGFLLRKPREDLRHLGPLVKLASLVIVAVLAVVMVQKTETFLKDNGIDAQKGFASALQQTSQRTSKGTSSFDTNVLASPALAPLALITVLFRPLIFEAHNLQALIAALESTMLLVLVILRWRWVVAALKSVRRQPYVAMAAVYVLLFVVAFSSLGNFGLLARERVQVLPFFLVLLTIPRKKEKEDADARA